MSTHPELDTLITEAREAVVSFFGEPFSRRFHLVICRARKDFDAAFPSSWEIGPTEGWMVAAGVSDRLILLDPAVWGSEASGHDPSDSDHVREILVHELTHCYHGQHNPTGDFTGAEEVGWFIEGLAVLVSGQFHRSPRESALRACREGSLPGTLVEAWSGPHRYGVCGSMAAFIDTVHGRDTIVKLLPACGNEDFLDILGLSESAFLADWRAWLGGCATPVL